MRENTTFVLMGFLVIIFVYKYFGNTAKIIKKSFSSKNAPRAEKIETQFYISNLNVIQNMQIAIPGSQAIRRKAVPLLSSGPTHLC